jgi:diguanylate cyclase (GGDEF)-like protein
MKALNLKNFSDSSAGLSIGRLLGKLSGTQGLFLGVCLSLLLTVLDGWTGYEVSFSFFYLIPVVIVAWTGSTVSGIWLISLFDAVLWQVSNLLVGERHDQAWIYIWNAASRGVFFVVTGLLIAKVKSMLIAESATARRDPLTRMLNRRGLEEAFEWESSRQLREPSTIALISIDLDRFKQLNDSAGHAEGDRLLVEFARVGLSLIRPTDIFSRIGGDEFVILVARSDKGAALEIAQRLQSKVEESFLAHGWKVGLSQGISFHTEGAMSLPDLLARADKLLYRAKNEGRARICIEDPDMRVS